MATINEIIILAGGFGTRLRHIVKDVPKPMADVNGRPFLIHILDHAHKCGIQKAILSIGYKARDVINYFENNPHPVALQYAIEDKPLGTGGGIKKAISLTKEKNVLILNGDTFFPVDISSLFEFHKKKNADVTIALKKMQTYDRYETIVLGADNRIKDIEKRDFRESGFINGGVYIANRKIFEKMPEVFSFEQEIILKNLNKYNLFGYPCEDYFIDIGIPEDYLRAKDEFAKFTD